MNRVGCKAALLCKGPLRSPDSEGVGARGTESNIEDTNTPGSNPPSQITFPVIYFRVRLFSIAH